LISGETEARLAFAGATASTGLDGPLIVSDIGGGSTELVTAESAVSIDVGSVRLTERAIPSRPPSPSELSAARAMVDGLFAGTDLEPGTLIGVAGTWTSLAAIAQDLPHYLPDRVHEYRLARASLERVIASLAEMTVEETAAIPSLDPKRAPVILAGGLIAEGVIDALGADEVLISEHDTLDGAARELLALA
jgi:exopolyphosphatase/guanosine-5'-triphosphate,3'-diphosphate pyrophosphatase